MSWVPHITVASIIEKNNEYLFVEEYINDKKVLNQPAGHLEEHETLEEGCIRETLEETAYDVEVDYLVGIYQERKKNTLDMWLRFCFKCNILEEHVDKSLDKNILRKLWLPKKELTSSNFLYRSDMVLKCIEDYEKGVKYPKEILKSLLEK